ncbi:hypothetical protein ACO0QE_000609 [Hanseniaspora vineae]
MSTHEGNGASNRKTQSKGLNTEIHSALLNDNLTLIKTQFQQPKNHRGKGHKYNKNRNHDGQRNKRKWDTGGDDDTIIDNPYLSGGQLGTLRKKPILDLHNFHTVPGGMSEKYEQERRRIEQERRAKEEAKLRREQEKQRDLAMVKAGEKPDTVVNESLILITDDILQEFENNSWDLVFLNKTRTDIHDKYTKVDYRTLGAEDDSDEDIDESEEEDFDEESGNSAPSVRYVLHPVPVTKEQIKAFDGDAKPPQLYLTKKEMKKLRRNKRKLDRQAMREKIRLGIEPKPEPKVRMSNIMKVVQNNANISDPTLFEKQVKEQIRERAEQHDLTNKQRHKEAVESQTTKAHEANQKRKELLESGMKYEVHCLCFKVSKLLNPKNRFKINTNCKQLKLQGCCLRLKGSGEAIIIAQGSEKSCKFFQKLIMGRIKWDESFIDKESGEEIDMSETTAELKWSGVVSNSLFKGKWFMKECHDLQHLLRVLDEFDCRQYWN